MGKKIKIEFEVKHLIVGLLIAVLTFWFGVYELGEHVELKTAILHFSDPFLVVGALAILSAVSWTAAWLRLQSILRSAWFLLKCIVITEALVGLLIFAFKGNVAAALAIGFIAAIGVTTVASLSFLFKDGVEWNPIHTPDPDEPWIEESFDVRRVNPNNLPPGGFPPADTFEDPPPSDPPKNDPPKSDPPPSV